MEGLTTGHSGGGAKFLSIVGGQIVMRVEPNTKDARKRISEKNGKEMWELVFSQLTGKVTKHEIQDSEFGEQLKLTVTLPTTLYILTIPVESRYFDAYAKTFRNLDYAREVRFAPYSFKDKADPSKTISGMNILQEDFTEGWKKMDWFFTRDTPNGMPVSGDGLSKDELKMHFMQVHIFLKKQIREYPVPGQPATPPAAQNNSSSGPENDGSSYNPIDDDLPF